MTADFSILRRFAGHTAAMWVALFALLLISLGGCDGSPQMLLRQHLDPIRYDEQQPDTRLAAQVRPADQASAAPAGPGESTSAMSQAAGPTAAARHHHLVSLYGMPSARGAAARKPGQMANLKQITFAEQGGDFDPCVDPSGKWIVFASTRHGVTSDLYLKQVDGHSITQLTADPANDIMPSISPDGSQVVFASDRTGNWEIYLQDIRGGKPVQITNNLTDDLHASFSPDGRKLVYCTYAVQAGEWEMVVVDLQKPGTRHFIGPGLFPQWSPVEDRIVFQRARQRDSRWFTIWTVELDGLESHSPTEVAASSNTSLINPAWSADGQRIGFAAIFDVPSAEQMAPASEADIWMVNADGSERTRLTDARHANLQPTWAGNDAIYFVSNRSPGATDNIWALQTPAANAAPVNPAPTTPADPESLAQDNRVSRMTDNVTR